MNNKKKTILIIVLAIILVVGVTLGYSFAYFTSSMINTTTPTNTAITTGSMAIEFTDGPEITLENAIPGSYVEKTFSVKNVGTLDTVYDIYMSDLINTFADKTDLVYTLTSSNGANVNETQVPSSSAKIVSNQAIAVDETQNYTLRIEFKETNDNQDDNKNKKFRAVMRVNEVYEGKLTAVETINGLVSGADTSSIDVINKGSGSDGCTYTFAYDGTTDSNLRYVGRIPCNYVKFNNETWKIIGIMNNVENESGKKESLLKIVRPNSIGSYSWDTTEYAINNGYGINQWGATDSYEGSDLMRELNTDYLGNITVGTDGKWFNDVNNGKTANMPSTTIDSTSQNMIESVKWNLGSPNNNNGSYVAYDSSLLTTPYVYEHERADTNGKVCSSGSGCNDTVTRTSTWTGKVGLMYLSDIGYATDGGSYTRSVCFNEKVYYWYKCKSNNWLFYADEWYWTMAPLSYQGVASYSFLLYGGNSNAGFRPDYYAHSVHPVLYLKSSTIISSGTGTSTDPYILEL